MNNKEKEFYINEMNDIFNRNINSSFGLLMEMGNFFEKIWKSGYDSGHKTGLEKGIKEGESKFWDKQKN